MHRQLAREMSEKVDKYKTLQWLSKNAFKIGQKELLRVVQEEAVRTNYVKQIMVEKSESVQHLVSGSEKLAQKEFKRRHNSVAKKIHWDLCKQNGLEHREKQYELIPKGVVENEVEVLWDINGQCDNVIAARRPDIIVTDNKERKRIIINVTVPADERVGEKEMGKVEKYQDLKREIRRLRKLKMV